ncbi:uncharacterized protein EI90DRAFT_3016172 [Cantharellus anzutake]|uniref:uncharacterized protein n=1 Tax=Cantharellus anzutake TaxID=1750568 RepID=UPI0019083C9B|nr:uncharacterized protein EI90DRAFT_3016172 [Cantharellus anzutake]KAF8332084.1 hypothetical protein EI90DRAFT_3016172 [Cantharellus anzutake]
MTQRVSPQNLESFKTFSSVEQQFLVNLLFSEHLLEANNSAMSSLPEIIPVRLSRIHERSGSERSKAIVGQSEYLPPPLPQPPAISVVISATRSHRSEVAVLPPAGYNGRIQSRAPNEPHSSHLLNRQNPYSSCAPGCGFTNEDESFMFDRQCDNAGLNSITSQRQSSPPVDSEFISRKWCGFASDVSAGRIIRPAVAAATSTSTGSPDNDFPNQPSHSISRQVWSPKQPSVIDGFDKSSDSAHSQSQRNPYPSRLMSSHIVGTQRQPRQLQRPSNASPLAQQRCDNGHDGDYHGHHLYGPREAQSNRLPSDGPTSTHQLRTFDTELHSTNGRPKGTAQFDGRDGSLQRTAASVVAGRNWVQDQKHASQPSHRTSCHSQTKTGDQSSWPCAAAGPSSVALSLLSAAVITDISAPESLEEYTGVESHASSIARLKNTGPGLTCLSARANSRNRAKPRSNVGTQQRSSAIDSYTIPKNEKSLPDRPGSHHASSHEISGAFLSTEKAHALASRVLSAPHGSAAKGLQRREKPLSRSNVLARQIPAKHKRSKSPGPPPPKDVSSSRPPETSFPDPLKRSGSLHRGGYSRPPPFPRKPKPRSHYKVAMPRPPVLIRDKTKTRGEMTHWQPASRKRPARLPASASSDSSYLEEPALERGDGLVYEISPFAFDSSSSSVDNSDASSDRPREDPRLGNLPPPLERSSFSSVDTGGPPTPPRQSSLGTGTFSAANSDLRAKKTTHFTNDVPEISSRLHYFKIDDDEEIGLSSGMTAPELQQQICNEHSNKRCDGGALEAMAVAQTSRPVPTRYLRSAESSIKAMDRGFVATLVAPSLKCSHGFATPDDHVESPKASSAKHPVPPVYDLQVGVSKPMLSLTAADIPSAATSVDGRPAHQRTTRSVHVVPTSSDSRSGRVQTMWDSVEAPKPLSRIEDDMNNPTIRSFRNARSSSLVRNAEGVLRHSHPRSTPSNHSSNSTARDKVCLVGNDKGTDDALPVWERVNCRLAESTKRRLGELWGTRGTAKMAQNAVQVLISSPIHPDVRLAVEILRSP